MIDLHIHILPCVDDGSFSLQESLRMARMAVESGVTEMAATPHCNLPDDPVHLWAEDFLGELEHFRAELKRENIPLKIHSGMEIFGTFQVPELFREGKLMPLAGSRYPLIEFPFSDYGEEATHILGEVLKLGYRPIVAHPERYHYVQRYPHIVDLWTDMGCYLQVNRGSLLGRFGRGPADMAYELLDRGFVLCAASDAHRSTVRTPWMADIRQLLTREYSKETAETLLERNPRKILLNEEIEMEEPDWF